MVWLIPALLAASLHWVEGPQTFILALCLLCLALLSRRRRALWLWAWVLIEAQAGVNLALGAVPLLYLSLLKPNLRILPLLGCLIALHANVSFLAFRLAGGSHGWRPEIAQPWLQALVWPYYCGHYPRGAHAIGLFLNDNLLGLWCVAVLALTLELPLRPRLLTATPLLLAIGWSYSRSAYLALAGACLWLAWRRSKRLLLVPLLIPLLFVPFATGLDHWRFSSDWASTLGGRAENLQHLLAHPSLLGHGPSTGLIDSQWIKTGLELGWLGLLVQLGFCLSAIRAARPAVQAGLIALVLGGIGCDLWYSPHLAGTFMLLSTLRDPRPVPDVPAADRADSESAP